MTVNKELLSTTMAENIRPMTDSELNAFCIYSDMLVKCNEKVNLTAILDPDGIAIKHFLDSVMLLKYYDIPVGATLIDVGTGAGFPSLPCKIMRSDIKITMLDSLNKRVNFLTAVSDALGMKDNISLHFRAEEGSRKDNLREKFDVATARAVSNLAALCEYCLPYVKVGGVFIALKGPNAQEEIEDATNAITLLGGELMSVHEFNLPKDNGRTIVIIKKISQTSTKYPRISTKISKSPL